MGIGRIKGISGCFVKAEADVAPNSNVDRAALIKGIGFTPYSQFKT